MHVTLLPGGYGGERRGLVTSLGILRRRVSHVRRHCWEIAMNLSWPVRRILEAGKSSGELCAEDDLRSLILVMVAKSPF